MYLWCMCECMYVWSCMHVLISYHLFVNKPESAELAGDLASLGRSLPVRVSESSCRTCDAACSLFRQPGALPLASIRVALEVRVSLRSGQVTARPVAGPGAPAGNRTGAGVAPSRTSSGLRPLAAETVQGRRPCQSSDRTAPPLPVAASAAAVACAPMPVSGEVRMCAHVTGTEGTRTRRFTRQASG